MSAEVIACMRIGQLLIASLLGFGCIWLGYRLFTQIPVTVTATGDFKMPKFGQIKLKAGPVIFFALFGAFAIYASIDRSISIARSVPDHPSVEDASTPFSYSCQSPGFSYSNTTPGSNGVHIGPNFNSPDKR